MHPSSNTTPALVSIAFISLMALGCRHGPDNRYDEVPPGGVEVIDNAGRADGPTEFRLAGTPVLRVGGHSDRVEEELESSMGELSPVLLSDGGLAVAEETRIHFFDATGVRRTVIGRRGSGPGEFLSITAACGTRGDTIVVEDFNNARITVVDGRAGTIVRAFSNAIGHLTRAACFADGTFLTAGVRFDPPTKALDLSYRRVRLDGALVREMKATHRSRERLRQVGSPAISASRDHWYFADPYFSEIRTFDTLGVLQRVIRTDDPLREVSQQEANAARGYEPAKGNTVARIAPTKARRPFFSMVASDPNGALWLRDPDQPDAEYETWTAFDPSGKLQGQLRIRQPPLGEKFYVLAFLPDGVIMRRGDKNGDAFVEVYRFATARP